MLFVTVISPTQQYLLKNALSTRQTTKVGMFSCVKVLCITTTIKNITKKILNNVI